MIIFWSFPGWARVVQTVKNVNDSTDNMVKISETADKTLTYVTKVTGVSTGAAGAAKGTVDMLEAVACQDGVCAVVSGIGVCADGLSMAASFIPGPTAFFCRSNGRPRGRIRSCSRPGCARWDVPCRWRWA